MKRLITFTSVLGLCTLLAPSSHAQIGFSVTRQNGVPTGGNFFVVGAVNPSRTGVRLGINASASELVDVQTFSFNSPALGNNQASSQGSQQQLAASQFVRAAGRFDQDKNELLSRPELEKVAKAVVAEIRKMDPSQQPLAFRQQLKNRESDEAEKSTDQVIIEAFVKRCMTFDTDDDNALNPAEARSMAKAFLRSLG